MPPSDTSDLGAAASWAACAGLAAHLVFIRGEWHMQAPWLAIAWLVSPLLVMVWFGVRGGGGEKMIPEDRSHSATPSMGNGIDSIGNNRTTWLAVLMQTAVTVLSFNAALWGSIILYRMLFHPLKAFPGPQGARVSKLWQVSKLTDKRNHLLIDDLHKQYGPIVRTGPNEVTICDPAVMPAINGSNTCIKAPVYDLSYPLKGINLSRNFAEHHGRRRIWDPAFNNKALDRYSQRISIYGEQLSSQILKRKDQPLLVNDWLEWFSFDVIGDLALSKSFGMLQDAKWQDSIKIMKDGMGMFGMLTPIPWFCRIGASLPGSQDEGLPKLLEWCRQRVQERIDTSISSEDKDADIVSHLIDGSRAAEGDDFDVNWLYGDGFAMIAAGSETVGLTLVFIFRELARDHRFQDRILEELKQLKGFSVSVNRAVQSYKDLRHCNYLNGFINEVMRLYPAVPTSGYRIVGAHGLHIGEQYIPPGTTVSGPRWSLGRLESCFEYAEENIPERWYSQPQMVKDRRAFSPFSTGKMNCIGQNLAMIELRYIIALLVGNFVINFAPGEDGRRVVDDMIDAFSAVPGDLKLVFSPRK